MSPRKVVNIEEQEEGNLSFFVANLRQEPPYEHFSKSGNNLSEGNAVFTERVYFDEDK